MNHDDLPHDSKLCSLQSVLRQDTLFSEHPVDITCVVSLITSTTGDRTCEMFYAHSIFTWLTAHTFTAYICQEDLISYLYLFSSTIWSSLYCKYVHILLPQIKTVSSVCTEVLILEQKNLKIQHEMESHNREKKAIIRSITSLSNKLLSLNLKLCERKDLKETLDKDNLYTQNHYMKLLKVWLSFKVTQNPLWSYHCFTSVKLRARLLVDILHMCHF